MREITENRIYDLLKDKYNRVCCDYVILSSDDEYRGFDTHQKAVVTAFEILDSRYSSFGLCIDIEKDKMTAVRISVEEFLEVPSEDHFAEKEKQYRSYTVSEPIPYWYAFLDTPNGTPYLNADFLEFNDILFPDRDNIEIYRWNDDFSSYFDDGKEWWGTGLWSIYDIKTGVFVIIGASFTD